MQGLLCWAIDQVSFQLHGMAPVLLSEELPLSIWVLGELQGRARRFGEQENLLRLPIFKALIGQLVMLLLYLLHYHTSKCNI